MQLSLLTIFYLQKFPKNFEPESKLLSPLACADFSKLFKYYQTILPSLLLNRLLRNTPLRNIIFENEHFIFYLSSIKENANYNLIENFKNKKLHLSFLKDQFIVPFESKIPLNILKDFNIIFTLIKFKQCNSYLKKLCKHKNKEGSAFLLYLIRSAFDSFQNKQNLSNFDIDQLAIALKNSLSFSTKSISFQTAEKLFQMSLQFLSTCNQYFSKNSKKLMLLLIKVAIKWIQKFLTLFAIKPKEHRKKILFMAQKLSSASFIAFFKSVNHIHLKFQLLKFTK